MVFVLLVLVLLRMILIMIRLIPPALRSAAAMEPPVCHGVNLRARERLPGARGSP